MQRAADLGEAKIQLQPAGELSAGSGNVLTGPYAVFDYGFAERWEVVLEGAGQAPPAGGGPTPVSNEAMLKYVVQPGVLQGKPGTKHRRRVRAAIAEHWRVEHGI